MMNEIYFVCGCLLLMGIILFTVIDLYAYIRAPRSARRILTVWLVVKVIFMLMFIALLFTGILDSMSTTISTYPSSLAIGSQFFWAKMTQPISPFLQKIRIALVILAFAIALYTLARWLFAPLPHFR
jgi:hypothetical protein